MDDGIGINNGAWWAVTLMGVRITRDRKRLRKFLKPKTFTKSCEGRSPDTLVKLNPRRDQNAVIIGEYATQLWATVTAFSDKDSKLVRQRRFRLLDNDMLRSRKSAQNLCHEYDFGCPKPRSAMVEVFQCKQVERHFSEAENVGW